MTTLGWGELLERPERIKAFEISEGAEIITVLQSQSRRKGLLFPFGELLRDLHVDVFAPSTASLLAAHMGTSPGLQHCSHKKSSVPGQLSPGLDGRTSHPPGPQGLALPIALCICDLGVSFLNSEQCPVYGVPKTHRGCCYSELFLSQCVLYPSFNSTVLFYTSACQPWTDAVR